jgi:Cu2+-exporting ATPase
LLSLRPATEGRAPFVAQIDGRARGFCCGGCQTLAQTLHAAGFGHLYGDVTRFARPIDAEARREAEPGPPMTPRAACQFVRLPAMAAPKLRWRRKTFAAPPARG